MKWFRLWHDMIDNPKVQNLSTRLFKAYINTLCIASTNEPRGTLPDLTKYAFKMRVKPSEAQKILTELENYRLIFSEDSKIFIHDWDEHQRNSDNIAVRVQRHREKSNVTGNVTETEDETKDPLFIDTEERRGEKRQDENNPPTPRKRGNDERQAESSFDLQFWPAYPNKKSKAAAKKSWVKLNPDENLVNQIIQAISDQEKEKANQQALGVFCPEWPHPASWLNGCRWEDEIKQTSLITPSKPGGYNGYQKPTPIHPSDRMLAIRAAKQSQNAAPDSSETGRLLSDVQYSVER